MNQMPYQRLPGRGWTWTGPSRVWLGEDHLLLVLGRGFYESYRRFFLNDIQAVIVRRTHTGKTWNAIWLMGLVFFGTIAALVPDPTGRAILVGLATPFAVGLLANLILGPTCACHIRTAVQTERVPAISRLGTARGFMARVEPLIVARQGELPPPELAAGLTGIQGQPEASVNAPPLAG
jgi:hypothetical protein